jgi:ElaB/YqjD/DUF883 family membrane-anchored ribosome-binding protein
MTTTATRRLRSEARTRLGEVEEAIEGMAGHAGERLEAMATRADRSMRRVGRRVAALEDDAMFRARRVGAGIRDYVGEHPWLVIGGFAILMLAAGALSRGRQ